MVEKEGKRMIAVGISLAFQSYPSMSCRRRIVALSSSLPDRPVRIYLRHDSFGQSDCIGNCTLRMGT
jgi:hypothetical protein